ncbi:MAG: GNAT family N-acetyltransferase [Bacteroidales bacterium]|nr:GNAT family N-acetyltransferase [Bacteroidales bacterium]
MSNKDNYTIRILSEEEYPLWDDFVENEGRGTLFHKAVWLKPLYEIYSQTGFRIIGCFDNNDRIIGGLAYGHKRKLGIEVMAPPVSTIYWSPLIKARDTQYVSKVENYEFQLYKLIIEFLENHVKYALFQFPPHYRDIRPFLWNGYKNSVKYTYTVSLKDENELFNAYSPSLKRQIKKGAKEDYKIVNSDSEEQINAFYQLQHKTFERQRKSPLFSKEQFSQLARDFIKNGLLSIYIIYKGSSPVYGICISKGINTAYYWLAGGDPEYFNTGLNQLLMHEILKDLVNKGLSTFDFIGANTYSITQYKSNFGFKLTPFYEVEKISGQWAKALFAIKHQLGK